MSSGGRALQCLHKQLSCILWLDYADLGNPTLDDLGLIGGVSRDEVIPTPKDLINAIRDKVLAADLTLLLEPGRSMVATCGALVNEGTPYSLPSYAPQIFATTFRLAVADTSRPD